MSSAQVPATPEMSSVDITSHFEYVGFWQRVLVALLDTLMLSPLALTGIWTNVWSFRLRAPWLSVVPALTISLLTLFLVMRFGGTPGKLILKMRIVDRNGAYLRLRPALLRDFVNWLSIGASLLLLLHVMSVMPPNNIPGTMTQIGEALNQYGGWRSRADTGIALLGVADVLFVSCNRRKRAIHDFLAGSFVITKRSYDSVAAESFIS